MKSLKTMMKQDVYKRQQYDLINILKTHNKISSKERKINIIVGSIILWILILLFSSKYLYNILQS